MAGLFDKDFRIILQRKQMIVLFLIIAVVLGFSTDGTFIVGYTTFCFIIIAVSTISYDEFDNGFSFIMTLPVTRRTYVLEKYILCSICGAAGWIFSLVVCICINLYRQCPVRNGDLIMKSAVLLPVVLIILGVMIPVQFKFGSEKSRIVLIVAMGLTGAVIIGINKAAEAFELPIDSLFEKVQKLTDVQILIGYIVFTMAAMLLSFAVSFRIIENKEF